MTTLPPILPSWLSPATRRIAGEFPAVGSQWTESKLEMFCPTRRAWFRVLNSDRFGMQGHNDTHGLVWLSSSMLTSGRVDFRSAP